MAIVSLLHLRVVDNIRDLLEIGRTVDFHRLQFKVFNEDLLLIQSLQQVIESLDSLEFKNLIDLMIN